MADSYRWDLTSHRRERKLEALVEASSENSKANAVDDVVETYLALVGENEVMARRDVVDKILQEATNQGGLEAAEIAETLGEESDIPVEFEPAKSASAPPSLSCVSSSDCVPKSP